VGSVTGLCQFNVGSMSRGGVVLVLARARAYCRIDHWSLVYTLVLGLSENMKLVSKRSCFINKKY
jgi:hypothetical protein